MTNVIGGIKGFAPRRGVTCLLVLRWLPFRDWLLIWRPLTRLSQKWFAAVLLPYNERDPFLDRDAGLFYRGFKSIGVDARFVALGEHKEGAGDVLLGSVEQL